MSPVTVQFRELRMGCAIPSPPHPLNLKRDCHHRARHERHDVHHQHRQERVEELEVVPADALPCPRTVVIQLLDATVAVVAMLRVGWSIDGAD